MNERKKVTSSLHDNMRGAATKLRKNHKMLPAEVSQKGVWRIK